SARELARPGNCTYWKDRSPSTDRGGRQLRQRPPSHREDRSPPSRTGRRPPRTPRQLRELVGAVDYWGFHRCASPGADRGAPWSLGLGPWKSSRLAGATLRYADGRKTEESAGGFAEVRPSELGPPSQSLESFLFR